MSRRATVFLACAVVAFLVAALRFLPNPPLSKDALDFVSGLGVGLLIGALVTWTGDRGATH